MSQYEEQVRVKRDLERRVVALLEPMLGIGNVRVQASMDYDFDAVQRTVDKYDPERQVVRSEERTEEEDRTIEGAKPAQGGQAGAEANDPGAQQTVAAAGGASATKRGTERTNYEIDKTTEVVVRQSGVLKRLSLAVLVNDQSEAAGGQQAQPIPEATKKLIEDLVTSAVGFDQQRGDTIKVAASPFRTNGLEPPGAGR